MAVSNRPRLRFPGKFSERVFIALSCARRLCLGLCKNAARHVAGMALILAILDRTAVDIRAAYAQVYMPLALVDAPFSPERQPFRVGQ